MELLKKIKSIISWFKSLGQGILLYKYHLLWLIIPIMTIFYLFYYREYEPKLVSSVLLISGLIFMVLQFVSDVKQFAKEFPNSFRYVIFPKLEPKEIIIGPKTGKISIEGYPPYIDMGLSQDASLEKKINFIFSELDAIKSQQRILEKKVRDDLSKVNGNIKELEDLFQKKMRLLNSAIAGHVVGSFDKNILSVILTACGIIIQLLT